jgi:hypothetical protein
MKRIRLALLSGTTALATLLSACADDPSTVVEPGEVEEAGHMRFALEATSSTGARYRLRQAVFLVDQQQDPFGGIFGGGLLGGGLFGGGVGVVDGGMVFPPDSDAGVFFPFGPTTFKRALSINSEEDPQAPELRRELQPGTYRVFLTNGWFVERVDQGSPFEVSATLVGSATQSVFVSSGSDSVVEYAFQIDGNIVTFSPRGGLAVRPVFIDDNFDGSVPDASVPPLPFEFDALLERDSRALGVLSLRETLAALGSNAGLTSDAEGIYHGVIDSFASAANARQRTGVHCGDETTGGVPSLNGFPIVCDRAEAQQFDNLDTFRPTAAVSRLDLAPADGSTCGQQRLAFATGAINRMFMIVEAEIPNPHPECGVSACQPIAQAWEKLLGMPAELRGEQLRQMFITGSPELSAAGFGPFMSANNLTVGSGQIRTNSFDSFPWTLREWKLVLDETSGSLSAVPFPVSEAPHGSLWNDLAPSPVGEQCRNSFLNAMESLVTNDLGAMRFIVDEACKDAESQNDFFTQDYANALAQGSGAFSRAIEQRFAGTGLSATDFANRARFAGSCIGCHQEASGFPLGNGLVAPFSNDFPQIQEFTEPCADGSFNCSALSPALRDAFLPQRRRVQDALLATSACGGPIELDAGSPQDAGIEVPPFPVDGGVLPPFADAGLPPFLFDASTPVVFADAGVRLPTPVSGSAGSGGASSGTVELVPMDTANVDALVAADRAARAGRQGRTLGGQPALTTH